MIASMVLALVAQSAALAFGVERYEVDARTSTVGFDATSPLHDFTGRTHAITGDLRADRDDPARIAGGVVRIEVRTLDTGNGTRDGEMRDLLRVKRHPHIVFRLDSVRGALVSGKGEFTAQGAVEIAGVERPRVLRFHVEPVQRGLRVLGEVRFRMSDHGIEPPGVLLAKVADEVRVWFDLTLRAVGGAEVEARVRTLEVEEEFTPADPGTAPRRASGTERVWRTDTALVWERRLEPSLVLRDAHELVLVDPRTGSSRPAAGALRQAMEHLARPEVGAWATSCDERDGRRTVRLSISDEMPGRLPAWVLDRGSWAVEPR